LGSQLRELREARGISREAAAEAIRASDSKISRMELGRVGFKERDVTDLLTLYGVVDEQKRGALLALAQEANIPGWWHRYNDLLPSWFLSYLGLEAAAAVVRTYEVQFVPGLLQTRDYARAVIKLSDTDASAKEVERRVDLRMDRQRQFAASGASELWAVVDEAALRRPLGGPAVMRAQLECLVEATERPHVRLQVMPFGAGGHAAAGGGFVILRFREKDLPDIVYLEHLTSALYLYKREDVDRYVLAMGRLCVEAEPTSRTREILGEALREYGGPDD
jgi:transcriptional regulator with XRE-family HTH domain